MPETRFGELEARPWTLLVQSVDHHVPEVAALIEPFRFVPNWRIDDVLVSYATAGGGVGPHFDQYDVFLVQGLGRRRWQIGPACDQATPMQTGDDLRLLADFEPVQEWILEPGDILYLPPRIAHDGVAVSDDCMTYSIGFRAPSRRELIAGWAESLTAELDDDDRYADPDLATQDNPGEIAPAAIARLHAMISERWLDREAFAQWFGQFVSAPRNPEIDWRPDEAPGADMVRSLLTGEVPLLRNPASRFSFVRSPAGLSLFVDGRSFACSGATASFAEQLCAHERVTPDPPAAAAPQTIGLIVELIALGSLAFDQDN